MKPIHYTFIVLGEIPVKKNNYRVSYSGGVYTDRDVKDTIDDITNQLAYARKRPKPSLDKEFEMKVDIFTSNPRKDLDGMVTTLLDCLQKAEIIKNDNLLVHEDNRKHIVTSAKAIIEISLIPFYDALAG